MLLNLYFPCARKLFFNRIDKMCPSISLFCKTDSVIPSHNRLKICPWKSFKAIWPGGSISLVQNVLVWIKNHKNHIENKNQKI